MARSELPLVKIHEQLRASGVEPPVFRAVFMMSSYHSDQHFGNLTISDEFWSVGTMPQGCTVYIDEQKPENCRVNFDANLYDRNGMRAMLDRYLRLLEAAAREPELPIGTLLTMTGAKPLRWKCANYAAAFLRVCYGLLRLVAVVEDAIEARKKMAFVKRLTIAGMRWTLDPVSRSMPTSCLGSTRRGASSISSGLANSVRVRWRRPATSIVDVFKMLHVST